MIAFTFGLLVAGLVAAQIAANIAVSTAGFHDLPHPQHGS